MFDGGTKPVLVASVDDQAPEPKVAAIDKKTPNRAVKELAAAIQKDLDEVHRELDSIEELIEKPNRDRVS